MVKFASSYALAALVLSLFFAAQRAEAQTQVKISGFVNFSYGTWGSGSVSRDSNLCVYKSDGDTSYYITASGSPGSFRVSSGSNNLSYSVEFKQSSGSYVLLSHGSRQSFSGADQADENCSGSSNASLRCTFSSSDLEAARPGSYSGTLYVMVEPS